MTPYGAWRYVAAAHNATPVIHYCYRIANDIVTLDEGLTCGWCGPVELFVKQFKFVKHAEH